MKKRIRVVIQFFKYGSVGIATNLVAYFLYLAISSLGVAPVLSMTVVYALASFLSFFGNKSWTFKFGGSAAKAFRKYIVIQFLGYMTNLFILFLMHYYFGVPHYISQLAGIVIVAFELFLLYRYFVFA